MPMSHAYLIYSLLFAQVSDLALVASRWARIDGWDEDPEPHSTENELLIQNEALSNLSVDAYPECVFALSLGPGPQHGPMPRCALQGIA